VKVVLIHPAQSERVSGRGRIYNRVWPPLDLATTGAGLRADGHDVHVIDANALGLSAATVAQRVADLAAHVVCVTSSALDRWQCPALDLSPLLAVMSAVRPHTTRLYLLGSHGTVRPEEMLTLTGADAVVRGEPEAIVRALIAAGHPRGVAGTTWVNDGMPVHEPDAHAIRLVDLPAPDLSRLPMDRYYYEVLGDHFTLFEMSRGCASECSFCLLDTYGVGVRRKPLDHLIAEVRHAVEAHGVRTAYFIDLEFTVLRAQVLDLCRALVALRLPLTWCCQTRLDLVDDELLDWMRRAGCRLIHAGVEAGSDRVLAATGKGLTLAQIRDGHQRIRAAGIETALFFLFGLPGMTRADAADIERLAHELAPTYPLFHVAAPYPGTAMYNSVTTGSTWRFSDDGVFPEGVEGPLTLPEIKALVRGAYRRYYLRPRYVWDRVRAGRMDLLWQQGRLFLDFVRR
jgi:radical SAM superfamily enzyme YgiQ (UPF0313 family)